MNDDHEVVIVDFKITKTDRTSTNSKILIEVSYTKNCPTCPITTLHKYLTVLKRFLDWKIKLTENIFINKDKSNVTLKQLSKIIRKMASHAGMRHLQLFEKSACPGRAI